MFDLLGQAWLSARRRTLAHSMAILSLGLGVAAFACLRAFTQSYTDSLARQITSSEPGSEFSLEAEPTIRIEVSSKQGRLDPAWVSEQVRKSLGRAAGAMVEASYGVKLGRHAVNEMPVFIVSSDWLRLQPHFQGIHERIAGRLFTREDDASGEAVCIVGHELAGALAQTLDSSGHTVKVNGRPFRVVGVVHDDGNWAHGLLLLSFSAARSLLRIQPPGSMAFLTATDPGQVESELAEVQTAVSLALGSDHIASVESPWLHLEPARQRLSSTRLLLSAVSLLPLAVGMLGLVSMLLANLNGRVHEIGVHRALGATGARQAVLVLCEAGAAGLLAGLLGTAVGTGVLHLLSSAWGGRLHMPSPGTPVAVLCGAMAGLLAGAIPARAAMRISPLAALRHE